MYAGGSLNEHRYGFVGGGYFVDHGAAGMIVVDTCGPSRAAYISGGDYHSS